MGQPRVIKFMIESVEGLNFPDQMVLKQNHDSLTRQ